MCISYAIWLPSEEFCLFVETRSQQKGCTAENEKLRNLEEKLICHMGLGSDRAVDSFVLAEAGGVGVQARRGLVHSFLESTDL